jgi:hypothetical protein
MKNLWFSGLLFLILLAVAVALDEDTYDEGLYTPAELQRNAQRKAFGMPPIPPKALKRKVSRNKNKGSGKGECSVFASSLI